MFNKKVNKPIFNSSIYLENDGKYINSRHLDFYKQFLYPTKTDRKKIDLKIYNDIFEQILFSNITKVNIIPSLDFSDSLFMDVLTLAKKSNFRTEIILPYNVVDIKYIKSILVSDNIYIKFMIHFPFDASKLIHDMELLRRYNIMWAFIVSNKKDLNIINKYFFDKIDCFDYFPLYTGSNIAFFTEYIFNSFDDIISQNNSKSQIYRKQILNEILFGKLYVFPSGNVYSNVNFPSIGNICESKLSRIIYYEILNSSSPWFFTRDYVICKKCLNRYLCPSISNYEIVANKYNMCYLNDIIV